MGLHYGGLDSHVELVYVRSWRVGTTLTSLSPIGLDCEP